ncbi:putative DNA polymerase I [Nannochloris sp. 'desiccata']|nr:hypothetical protein KSW81_005479 [Chlorella desiccata (nom. nud.)]KAH7621313.1 putative DNA polymerase I [Chlorella desiccata (nom. nud.)]
MRELRAVMQYYTINRPCSFSSSSSPIAAPIFSKRSPLNPTPAATTHLPSSIRHNLERRIYNNATNSKTTPPTTTSPLGFFADSSDPLPASGPSAQRMILIDAMALLYRSHFAFGPDYRLRNSAGEDTTVMFGFLSTFLSLMELHPPPTHVAVVFDASGKTFRHELFPGYKGQRPDTPEDIRAAVPKLQELLNAMGIVELCVPGVEADDVIGTVAVRSVEAGMAVAIASPDKDFFQLLRPGLILLRPPKKSDAAAAVAAGASKAVKYALQPYTDDRFREEWQGLEPQQFVDLLALMGDASDNVPGVEGIGPKTATTLLLRYGTLSEILQQAGDIIPKKRATAVLATSEGAAAAKLSRQLVEIRVDLDLPPVVGSLEKFRVHPPKDGGTEALRLLKEIEFEVHSTRIQALWKRMEIKM